MQEIKTVILLFSGIFVYPYVIDAMCAEMWKNVEKHSIYVYLLIYLFIYIYINIYLFIYSSINIYIYTCIHINVFLTKSGRALNVCFHHAFFEPLFGHNVH